MAPKKEAKQSPDDAAAAAELAALHGARQDLELGQVVLVDKLRQLRAENERLLAEVESLRARLTNAVVDCADILQHREEQAQQAETRAGGLQQQLDRLHEELAVSAEEAAELKEANAAQALRLGDAAALLNEKDSLIETVRKQHEQLDRMAQEVKATRAQVEQKDAALGKARAQIEELNLRCQASTQLRVLFGEPWLVQLNRVKLKGAVPHDREFNTLCCTAGSKQLVLHGGQSRSHEGVARQTGVLGLDTLTWEQPEATPEAAALLGHSASVIGRTRLMVFGGSAGEGEASSAAHCLWMDPLRWAPLACTNQPPARLCHAAAVLRDRVFVFGGMTAAGCLLGDLWRLDLDTMAWAPCACAAAGVVPSARKGASLCATEDGRRLFLFGGRGGAGDAGLLNDTLCYDVDRGLWTALNPAGSPPEPRENHVAAVLGGWLLVTGGCGAAAPSPSASSPGAAAAAAPGGRRLTDTHVLDMFTGTAAWEQLDEGAWGRSMPWLKQMSVTSAFQGNRLLTLLPSLHEELDELLVLEFTLPEEMRRLQAASRRQQDIVHALELQDEASATTSSSVRVSWVPPTKNREHIASYKLMAVAASGTAREVYTGRDTSFTLTGLKPSTEVVLCVKATYDDGSFAWSDSKAYSTKA